MIFSYKNFIKIIKDPFYLNTYRKIHKLYKHPRYTEVYTDIIGKEIKAVDSVSLVFMYKEIFEKEIYKFKAASDNPYIIDCGANIGLSVIYFKKLYPNARIVAFEPDPEVFKTLKYNLSIFDIADTELIPMAIWNKESMVDFYHEGADGGRIAIGEETKVSSIKTVRLREYMNRRVDFLKMDIEGAEHEVLHDCRDLLGNVKNLFVEYHSFKNKKQNLSEIIGVLSESGFRVYIEHIGIRSEHPFILINQHAGMDLQLNIYAYRNK